MPQFTGSVRWFNNAKGYGFLGRNDGGPDVFAHYTCIKRNGYKTLKEGEPVAFDIVQGGQGLQAENVIPLTAPHGRSPHTTASVPSNSPQLRQP